MKEEADEPVISETVEPPKVDEATVREHPDAAPPPTPFSLRLALPKNMAAGTTGSANSSFLEYHLFHKASSFLLETDGYR